MRFVRRLSIVAIGGVLVTLARRAMRRRPRPAVSTSAIRRGTFAARNGDLARLGMKVGATYASASARKVFASAERRDAEGIPADVSAELERLALARLPRVKAVLASDYARGVLSAELCRKVFAAAERRVEIDRQTELKSAQHVSERLGDMKGALMKLGQM
ncbi:MAG: hypothetical protein ACO32E_09510, partial [Ilumatobacteraceae bacterium]